MCVYVCIYINFKALSWFRKLRLNQAMLCVWKTKMKMKSGFGDLAQW